MLQQVGVHGTTRSSSRCRVRTAPEEQNPKYRGLNGMNGVSRTHIPITGTAVGWRRILRNYLEMLELWIW